VRPRRLIVSGDTAEQAKGLTEIDGVEVLVHESTFLEDTANHATEHLHSTATGAVRTALACGASHLVLTHFSARIKDGSVPLNEALEAASTSPLTISLANDGARIQLHPSGDVTHLAWSGNGWAA
jgi:ribonuclease Z